MSLTIKFFVTLTIASMVGCSTQAAEEGFSCKFVYSEEVTKKVENSLATIVGDTVVYFNVRDPIITKLGSGDVRVLVTATNVIDGRLPRIEDYYIFILDSCSSEIKNVGVGKGN